MNVIAGKYKGRKLNTVENSSTRPTLARVKTSLFCMIDEYISNSIVLDLFAGSGALGIECISRGAEMVYFCDSQKVACDVIASNLKNITEHYKILNYDYKVALNSLKNVKFDLVFLDPPYITDYGEKAIEILIDYNMLNNGAVIIFEHDAKKSLQTLSKDCIIIKQKVYGTKMITILKFKG